MRSSSAKQYERDRFALAPQQYLSHLAVSAVCELGNASKSAEIETRRHLAKSHRPSQLRWAGQRLPCTTSLSKTSLSKTDWIAVIVMLVMCFAPASCTSVFANGNGSVLGPSGIGSAAGIEVGAPLADPKFPITAFAQSAKKQRQGNFEALTFSGGVRIYQGNFTVLADEAVVWIDASSRETVHGQPAVKHLIEAKGNCEIRLGGGQTFHDVQWTGRLYSQFEIETQVDYWEEARTPVPDLTQPISPSEFDQVAPAISWTARDQASHRELVRAISQNMSAPTAGSLATNSSNGGSSHHVSSAAFQTPIFSNDVGPYQGGPYQGGPYQGGPVTPPLGQEGIILGSPSMGGTILEPGNMPSGATLSFGPPQAVQSFQNPAPGSLELMAPAPIAAPAAMLETLNGPSIAPRPIGAKNFLFSGRGSAAPHFESIPRPDRGDMVGTFTGGIRLVFGEVSVQTGDLIMDMGTVLIEADRAVIWTADITRLLSGQISGVPIELYLEGNIVFQQGARRIYAERMYYNVQSEYGMILGAELLTDAPQYEGILRLKADVIQQRSRDNFTAHQAAVTSSRLGVPRYWLQADTVDLKDRELEKQNNLFGRSNGRGRTDETGMKARSRHNFVYIEGVPIFYWPVLDTNVDTSSFYLSGAKYKHDEIFGNQVMLDWNLYQLLGIQAIDGTRWTLSTDYLDQRGFALGTNFRYNVPNFWLGGNAIGAIDAWGLKDKGMDRLGSDRWNLIPEKTSRGRLSLNHRQYLTPDTELWAEVGWISDRNFLEQYFESEWDTQKDATTGLRLRQYLGNQMLDLSANIQVNDFHTETSWLPRLDHYMLGQSLGQYFTYYTHSDVGYARMRQASTPTDPADAAKFQLQPYETDASGVQAMTRHELNLPIDTGFAKVVPYISGEAAYWGEDINGDHLSRLTGQAGWRTALPIWKVYPGVQSSIFNLNGLAHKINIENQFMYADTNKDLDLLPLYNPLDDNAQEHFRRRLVFNTFGGVLPDEFDSRNYAARQSLQRYVTATSNEVVTDQLQSRVGLHQRFQTKRGRVGSERIADVVEFDVDAIIFGDKDRDNFGEIIGGMNYDFRYHIGDRFTLVSDGYYDMFESGLKATTLGGIVSRPGRGDVYLGFTSLEGPISSALLTTSLNYRMNEKWLAMMGMSYDFSKTGNIGQSIAVTRIGESFLLRLGANIDHGRDNVSFQFALEPRFFQRTGLGLGVAGGQTVAAAGMQGLE